MITVLFSCDECGARDIECLVKPRPKFQDVKDYFDTVLIPTIGAKHFLVSPECESITIKELKVPIDDKDKDFWIGKQTNIVPPKGIGANK
jgi:hypothetical protein